MPPSGWYLQFSLPFWDVDVDVWFLLVMTIQLVIARGLLSMGQESWDRGKELMEQHSKPIQEGQVGFRTSVM